MIVLEINNLAKARFNKKFLVEVAQRTGERLNLKGNRLVSLALVGTAVSRGLNKKYRRHNRPTDVLSFASDAQPRTKSFPSDYFGEIVICYPLAKKQAKKFKTGVQAELGRLLVHGLLHLAGYHHRTAVQQRQMERLTAKILKK